MYPPRIVLGLMMVAVLALSLRAGLAQAQTPPVIAEADGATEEPESAYPPARNLEEALRLALQGVREVEKEAYGTRSTLLRADFYVQEAFRFDPSNRKAEYIAGRMNRLIGRSRDAFSQVTQYVRSAEGSVDWEAWKFLGDLHYDGKYYVQSEGKYRRAAELAPDEATIYISWARNCIRRAQRTEAVEKALKAVTLDPTSIDAHTVLAEAFEEIGRFAEAVTASKRAIRQLLGQLQERPGELQLLLLIQSRHLALQGTLRRLMNKQPSLASAYTDYVQSIEAATKIDQTVKMHEMLAATANGIVATQPDTPPEMIQQLVEFSIPLNQQSRAIEVLEAYLEQSPGNAGALQALRDLRAAGTAEDATAAASTTPTPLN